MHTLKFTDDYLEYINTYELKGYHRDQTMHTLKYTDDYLEYIYIYEIEFIIEDQTYEVKVYHRGPDYAHVKVYWWLPRIY